MPLARATIFFLKSVASVICFLHCFSAAFLNGSACFTIKCKPLDYIKKI